MIFYGVTEYDRQLIHLLAQHKRIRIGNFIAFRYLDYEISLHVEDDVAGEDCVIVGSTAPPLNQLFTLLVLADALKKGGASYVQVFVPYMGYSRQDNNPMGEWSGMELIGKLLRSAGIDSIITIDIHSRLDDKLINMPVINLFPAKIFSPQINRLGWKDYCIIAPDEGAKRRARVLAKDLGVTRPVAYMIKHRSDGIIHSELIGNICNRVIVVDDILDSGKTLVSACNLLKQQGVQEIAVVVTHGLFNNIAWRRLFALNVVAVFVSNSTPNTLRQHHPRLHQVSILPLLEAAYPSLILEEKYHEENA